MNLKIKTDLPRKVIKIFLSALLLISLIKLSNLQINFNLFCKLRSIDVFDFGVIVFSFIFLRMFWHHKTFKDKNIIFLIYPFLSLLTLIFFIIIGTNNLSLKYSSNIDAYRIFGGSCYMFLTGVFIYLSNYMKKIEVYSLIFRLIWSFAFIFLLIYILIRFFNYQPLLYGEGTPALFYPFDSPNQAGVFLLILLFLALGFCVFLKRTSDFIILCPIFSLAGFQTGSRTYGVLYFLFLFFLIFMLFLRFLQRYKIYHRELFNILFALLFSAILVLSFNDKTSSRPFSLLGSSFSEIVFKGADSFRMETNVLWGRLDELKLGTTPTKSTLQCTSKSEKADISIAKKADISNAKKADLSKPDLHNIFLEFFVFGGVYALVAYLLFISSLIYFSISLILENMNSLRSSFLKLTLFASLLCIFAFQYSNPVFGLKFTWLFYGSIIGLFLNSRNKLI